MIDIFTSDVFSDIFHNVLSASGFSPQDVPQAEADALIALYNATGGDDWANNSGWLLDPVVGNWHGITTGGGHVTRINLQSNQLTGEIPAEIGNLTGLTHIYLYSNQFSYVDIGDFVINGLWPDRSTLGGNDCVVNISDYSGTLSAQAIDCIAGTNTSGMGIYLGDGLVDAGCIVTY